MPMAKGIVRRGILPTTTVSTASLASASNLYIKDPSGFLSGDIVGIADVNVAGNTNETRTISSVTTISTTLTNFIIGGFATTIPVSDITGFYIGLQFQLVGFTTNGDGTFTVASDSITVANSFVSGTGAGSIPVVTSPINTYIAAGTIVSFSYITFTAPLTNAHPIGSLVSEINNAQNSSIPFKYNRYGDLSSTQLGDSHSTICNEGAYYKACSGKTATEVITYFAPTLPIATTGFFTTTHSGSAMIAMLNTGTYGAGIRIYLDYIKLIVVTPTFTTAAEQHYVITVNNYDRYNSGTITDPTVAPQIVNANSDYPNDSIAKLFFSSSTANLGLNTQPSGIPRVVARGVVKKNSTGTGAAFIAGDVFTIDFGEHKTEGQNISNTTTPKAYCSSNNPIDIGPGQFLSLHMYRGVDASAAAATFHIEMGWWER